MVSSQQGWFAFSSSAAALELVFGREDADQQLHVQPAVVGQILANSLAGRAQKLARYWGVVQTSRAVRPLLRRYSP